MSFNPSAQRGQTAAAPSSGLPNTFAQTIRQIAAEQADPVKRKSLFDAASKVDAADAMVRQAATSAQDNVLRNALRRRNDLPVWGVARRLLRDWHHG